MAARRRVLASRSGAWSAACVAAEGRWRRRVAGETLATLRVELVNWVPDRRLKQPAQPAARIDGSAHTAHPGRIRDGGLGRGVQRVAVCWVRVDRELSLRR
jgi:hypothetical protein